MIEIINSSWELVSGIVASVWGVVCLFGAWAWDVAYHLHVYSPRLEGLIVGVALAWLLLRREKHPLLRVMSAPLKLILDILDLVWDQCVEISTDVWDTAKGWTMGSIGWCVGKVRGAYDSLMGRLKSLKDKLSKKED